VKPPAPNTRATGSEWVPNETKRKQQGEIVMAKAKGIQEHKLFKLVKPPPKKTSEI